MTTELSDDEKKLMQLGQARFMQRLESLQKVGRASSTTFGTRLISSALPGVDKVLKQNLAYTRLKPIISTELMSFIGLSVVINELQPDTKFNTLAHSIGKAIVTECHAKEFKLPKNLSRQKLEAALKKHNPTKYKKSDILRMGAITLLAIEAKTNLLIMGKMNIGAREFRIVSPSQDFLRYYDVYVRENEFLSPLKRPITVFPIQYDADLLGGYAFDVIKGRCGLKYKERLQLERTQEHGDIERIRTVMNSTQSVPYEIDSAVLDVAWELYTSDKAVAGLPEMQVDLPKPPKNQTKEEELVFMKHWRQVKAANNSLIGKRFNAARTLMLAREFVDEDHIYFPVYLDFRGRIYYSGDYLQPQGADLAKSLLLFKSKKVIENDFFYFVHGANCLGYSSESYQDRYNHIAKRKDDIKAIARNPIKHQDLWVNAEEPFAYLAFALDCAKYLEDPENYESGLRCSADASSSGLQILSLLLRDEEGCKRTNVLPTPGKDKPSDIYMECVAILVDILKVDAASDSEVKPLAQYWLKFFEGKNLRNLVKRILMTTVYSLSAYGLRTYVQEWVNDNRPSSNVDTFKEDTYLSRRVNEAVNSTVKGAREGMDYIKDVTKQLANSNKYLELLMPNGFFFRNAYKKTKARNIVTKTQGHIYYTSYVVSGMQMVKPKAIAASVPNLIHALDACILYDVVESVPKSLPFSLVHDSVFFRAGDVDIFYEQVRDSIQKIFTPNLLEGFKDYSEQRTKVILPDVPPLGTINFDDIADSDYIYH